EARRGVTERLAAWAHAHRDPKRPLVWVHAPSVGEGLQAKPVLEALRAERPQWQLAYTFFSPSAERLARTLPADVTDYLPLDRPREPFLRLGAVRADAFTIVAGSTWPGDEAVVLPAFADLLAQVPAARLILAPHEPHPDHLAGIAVVARRLNLPRPVRLSQLE